MNKQNNQPWCLKYTILCVHLLLAVSTHLDVADKQMKLEFV